MREADLIKGCRKKDRRAQKALYDRYASRLLGVCRRYIRNRADAEETMLAGFFKIFDNIKKYRGKGEFGAWARRIMVNECLMYLRKRHNFNLTLDISDIDLPDSWSIESELAAEEIKGLIDSLPTGYGTVFNLYVLEGYKHREIADMLDISIHTSKSQLLMARQRLREMIEKIEINRAV